MGVVHRVRDGQLVPVHFSLRSNRPFEMECELQPWIAQIVARCQGKATWREHFEYARTSGMIDAATTSEEFASLLATLAGNGLLRVSTRPWPDEISYSHGDESLTRAPVA
jgi:hypothetical protein